MGRNQKNGWTLVEFIVVTAIIGIIAAVGAFSMIYLLRSSVYASNKLNVDMAASEAMDIMIEGDVRAKGFRFCKEIQSIVDTGTSEEVVFLNQDNVRVRYAASQNDLYRYLDFGGGWEPAEFIPYHYSPSIKIFGKDGRMFTYYDETDGITVVPADVRRIDIHLIAQIGTGDIDLWEARSELKSAIRVNRMIP